jgi:DNA repair exonuclease SbcCD ATPase subunit
VSNPSNGDGRIVARTIRGQNVISGVQAFNPGDPTSIAEIARNLRAGSITAEEIQAVNIVTGIQLTNEADDSKSIDALYNQVRALKLQIERLDAQNQSLLGTDDRDDLISEIHKLETELRSEEPRSSRARRTATNISDIIGASASAAENAGKLTTTLSGLALQGAALWHAIQQFFG